MDKDEIIGQLRGKISQLKHANELFKARITGFEAQLAKYENPHTPPSLKRGGTENRFSTQNPEETMVYDTNNSQTTDHKRILQLKGGKVHR